MIQYTSKLNLTEVNFGDVTSIDELDIKNKLIETVTKWFNGCEVEPIRTLNHLSERAHKYDIVFMQETTEYGRETKAYLKNIKSNKLVLDIDIYVEQTDNFSDCPVLKSHNNLSYCWVNSRETGHIIYVIPRVLEDKKPRKLDISGIK